MRARRSRMGREWRSEENGRFWPLGKMLSFLIKKSSIPLLRVPLPNGKEKKEYIFNCQQGRYRTALNNHQPAILHYFQSKIQYKLIKPQSPSILKQTPSQLSSKPHLTTQISLKAMLLTNQRRVLLLLSYRDCLKRKTHIRTTTWANNTHPNLQRH